MGVADLRARLAGLDATIIQQKVLLEQLEADRIAVQTELQSFVYPVLTLPHEITSEIFVRCLPDHLEHEPPRRMQTPILLLAVCKAWNNIAVSTPALGDSLPRYTPPPD
ncbi:hypothetical protein C8R44DRAFT_71436 [Mycena epipterygia]|nr:hypothetical protein C8R44DRAFT_71436 [Mycena epipterygia]